MITKSGLAGLQKRLVDLENELKRTSEERGRAAAEGDLKENSAYIFLGERADVLRTQIHEIKTDLKQEVVTPTPIQTNTVAFGHQVTINFNNDNRQMVITLVGKNDAHLRPEWINCDSPLGIALLGKRKGDTVDVNGQPVTILNITLGEI